MRSVIIFTVIYTVVLWIYGVSVGSPLTGLYLGINIGLFALFAVLNIWARWPIHALWAVSLVGLGNMLGGVLLVDGVPLYTAEVLGPIRYDKIFHAVAAGAMVVIAWEAMKRWSDGIHHLGGQAALKIKHQWHAEHFCHQATNNGPFMHVSMHDIRAITATFQNGLPRQVKIKSQFMA